MYLGPDKVHAWVVSTLWPWYGRGSQVIDQELLCDRAATMFVPIMASRLMLSLKKASIEPTGLWSLETMSSLSAGGSQRVRALHFASRISTSHQTSETLDRSVSEEEDIELNSVFQASQNRESQLCRSH